MDVRTVKSRLIGDMTFETGGPVLSVHDVKLHADPVDFDLLRTLNGKPFPADWQGKLTGNVTARGGPLTHFFVDDANVVFRDEHVPGAVSHVKGTASWTSCTRRSRRSTASSPRRTSSTCARWWRSIRRSRA